MAIHICQRTALALFPRKLFNWRVCFICLKNSSICQRLLFAVSGPIDVVCDEFNDGGIDDVDGAFEASWEGFVAFALYK